MDIVTVGSAIRDVFVSMEGEKVIRTAMFPTGRAMVLPLGSKLKIDALDITLGGDALNTAITFARRGFRTGTVAKVGDDGSGREILETLKDEGISTTYLMRDKKLQTAYSVILLADDGSRTILTYGGAARDFGPRDIAWNKLKPKWFFMTHMAEKSASVFPRVLRHAKSVVAKVAVNPGKTQLAMPLRTIKPLLNLIDVFIVNREEGAALTRTPYQNETKVFKKLDDWVHGLVVMTDGKRGVTVSNGTTRWKAGVLKEKRVVDRTGAGDAFGSGFVAALMERPDDIPYAIQVGSANATSVIEQTGGNAGALKKNQSIYKWGRLTIRETRIAS